MGDIYYRFAAPFRHLTAYNCQYIFTKGPYWSFASVKWNKSGITENSMFSLMQYVFYDLSLTDHCSRVNCIWNLMSGESRCKICGTVFRHTQRVKETSREWRWWTVQQHKSSNASTVLFFTQLFHTFLFPAGPSCLFSLTLWLTAAPGQWVWSKQLVIFIK